MKTYRFILLLAAIFGLTAFLTSGLAAKDVSASTETTVTSGPAATVHGAATSSANISSASWSDIETFNYDRRAQFLAGLKRLEARVDGQVGELTAKRATMKGPTDTKEWDFAMKEMNDARSALQSVGESLTKASEDTWNQEKDKVGQAWVRTQEAYAKVKASTTN